MRINARIWSLIAVVCMALPAVYAAGVDWASLDADTHALLAPWGDGWTTLSVDERSHLLSNAKRWQAMDATARTALLSRQTQWQALSPAERARLRARYAAWQALPADEQARVRASALRIAAMTPPQQGALRDSFAAQEINQRDAWLLGPSTGGWVEQAQTLFAFVPDGERDASLKMLQALSADTREQLFVLARRLPVDQREQLRKQLLATDPSQRAALVARRMTQQ